MILFQLNSGKEEVKSVLEKMEKQKEENEKKIEDEKKLTEANSKSHQTELQSKQDVSFNWTYIVLSILYGSEHMFPISTT